MPEAVLNWQFSDRFSALKRRIEPKLAEGVKLQINDSLEPGLYGRIRIPKRRAPMIVELEPQQSDTLAELVAAHEYFHAELLAEGFPMTCPTPGHEDWVDVMEEFDAMFHDPLVFERMEQFGYDVTPEYRRHVRSNKRQLKRIPEMPSENDWADYCHKTFLYVGACIELPPPYRNRFDRFFHKRYPQFATQASNLMVLLDESPFDTPASCRALMRRVLHQYGLGNILQLYCPGSWLAA